MAEFLSALDQVSMLRKSLGNPATGDVPDDSLVQFIWLAECDLASMYEFSELRSYEDVATVASTIDYELTEPDILRFLTPANNLTSGVEMDRMDADWDREIGSRFTGDGDVFYFFENGVGANGRKQIRVRPAPGGVSTLRIPFILIPTMPDVEEPSRSDLPASHTLQVLSRASEIGLQLINNRADAEAQEKLSRKAGWSAQHSLPGAAFYINRLQSFQGRMNLRRRRRG